MNKFIKTIILLVNKEFNLIIKNYKSKTALYAAINKRNKEIVSLH